MLFKQVLLGRIPPPRNSVMLRLIATAIIGVTFLTSRPCDAALITNMAMPITHRVTVQPIVVSNDDGSNTAEYFGNASQQGIIQGFVNTIWAQAGIQVDFLAANTWNNTFANIGNPLNNNPRPNADLNTVLATGDAAGVGNANPLVIDIYFVEISAGFSDTNVIDPVNGEFFVNGLAVVDGNGITQHVGDNLLSFTAGQEAVGAVVAHEIGHNLGLEHIVGAENLMQESPAAVPGERLNAMQIATARMSTLAVAVPEPASVGLLSLAGCIAFMRRRRHASNDLTTAA